MNEQSGLQAFVTEDQTHHGIRLPLGYDERGAYVNLADIDTLLSLQYITKTGRLYVQNYQEIYDSTILQAAKGRITINTDASAVNIDGQPVELTSKEYGALTFLARRLGSMVTRSELLENVWDTRMISVEQSRTVDVHINRLRHKLGKDDLGHPKNGVLQTIRQRGYRLN